MKRTLVILVGVVILAAAGAWVYRSHRAKPERARVRVLEVREGDIEDTVDATGGVAPLNRVEIKPPISGRIEQLLVEEGASVRAGQIVAWMSSSDRAAILDAARAKGSEELKRWEDSYKATPIIAPLSGVVILRNAVVGQTVDMGTVIYAMSDSLIVLAQVDESDIGRIRVGMPTRIWLDSYPDNKVPGKVFDILFEGKNVSNVITYGVKVKPDKVPDFFRSQMTANVRFIVKRKEGALLVPAIAVRELGDGSKQVLVPGTNGKPEPLAVETGVEDGENIEIVSGLESGDQVVIAQGRYKPQQAMETSPLVPTGPRRDQGRTSGQAPRSKRSE
ncbi:MAG: efflux RND transporter periplasmic adaptor subunit [Elusimicrobiota bacterium]